mgnify:CR=1 FL=1
MGLNDWWYYTGSTTKALVIIGIVAITLLAIILASPYVKPLQVITTKLGLMQEKVVYVPVNHTVYVNRTIVKYVYVNQTVPVPIYINRTIYVPVPSNMSGIPSMLDMGTCHLYSLVFSNGTVWTLGYWIPTPWAWELYGPNSTLIIWGRNNGTAGFQYVTEFSIAVIQPGAMSEALLPLLANVPYKAPPGWVYMIYMGDWAGIGPIAITDAKVVNNTLVIPGIEGNPPVALPINSTVTVVIMPYTQPLIPLLLPCNWTVIETPLTPEQALALPAPMGELAAGEAHYIFFGNYEYGPAAPTWGYWVWNTNYPMQNVTNLPWPIG